MNGPDPPIDPKPFELAEGGYRCVVCGECLYAHPQPLKETCPAMVEDCNGNWWKL